MAIILVACQPLVPQSGDGWQLRGRMAIRTNEDSTSLSIRWSQTQDQFDIRLTATLGISVAHIYGDADSATLESDDGFYSAASAQELLQQQTGLIFPVHSLRHWVRGKPAPDAPYQWLDKDLSQSGWLITYKSYKDDMPAKLKLVHPDVTIVLAIKQWL